MIQISSSPGFPSPGGSSGGGRSLAARWILLCWLVASFLFTGCPEEPGEPETAAAQPDPVPPPRQTSLQVLLATTEALLEPARVPGAALAWVEDGDFSGTGAVGAASVAGGARVTAATVFEAASLSKPVVAYLTLRLVERGSVELDRPLLEQLPDGERTLPGFEDLDGDPRLGRLTPRHVLSHATGLPNWRPGRWSDEPGALSFGAEPGERFGYSGEGYVLLQRTLEALTGLPFQELAEREVFERVGMPSSSFVWRDDYETLAARPHDPAGEEVEKSRPVEANAAASLHTTAGDYGRFLAEVLDPEHLAPELAREMLTPQVMVESEEIWGGRIEAPPTGRRLAWGLGWGLELRSGGDVDGEVASIWHWGDNGTFRCFVLGKPLSLPGPEAGDGLVLLTNSYHGLAIAPKVVEGVFPGPHPAFGWLGYGRFELEPAEGAGEKMDG